jgi:antibiotic biosynthesis monooxygenase (ABM) superfamily enzyme
MISRQWHGVAKPECADAYVEHLRTETFPAIRRLPGFRGATIFRRSVPEGVEFLVVTEWESLAAVRAFAGKNVELAVVPDKVQAMMLDYDRVVRHYEIVA